MALDDLQYTLLSDGPADKALMPILTWLLREHLPNLAVQGRWADLRQWLNHPKTQCEKIRAAVRLYPCNLLFVHRDAERISAMDRKNEIETAVRDALVRDTIPPVVSIVPVRMTEAWLLFDERAIRAAAGNPNGTVNLSLPRPTEVETIPNPKSVLHHAIRDATEKSTRRRDHFGIGSAVQRVPQYIENFSPLRVLSAVGALEERMVEVIEEQHWCE